MPEEIEDLSPFFDDPCWMCVLLAREADVGVILRRGPTQWWRVTLWDTKRDTFEGGQWFRGRIYPEKCDVSPNGKLFIYFAGQFHTRNADKGYRDTWTAVSRPPFLTALTLWPIGDTWAGTGVFIDNYTVSVIAFAPQHHPKHPLGPLTLVDDAQIADNRPQPSWNHGWRPAEPASEPRSVSVKSCGDLILGREVHKFSASRIRKPYAIYRKNGDLLTLFEAHWADWDQQGRLVVTVGGRVLVGELTKKKRKLRWRQLAAMHEEKPIRMEAPDWAQRW
jgi:hypothetical protein